MAVQTSILGDAFAKVMKDELERTIGIVHVEGLTFKVRAGQGPFGRSLFGQPPLIYDRPFTRQQHRANEWRLFKTRWKRRLTKPYRIVKYRAPLVWDALRGIDRADDWY